LSGNLLAAEGLPPLRVDPALLGRGVSQVPAPSAAEAAAQVEAVGALTEKMAAPAERVRRAAPFAPSTSSASPASPASPAKPVVAAPPLAEKKASPPVSALPKTVPVAAPAPLLAAPKEPIGAAPTSARSGAVAQSATAAPAPPLAQPPQVVERPSLAPTYSAHVRAGALPHPVLHASGELAPLPEAEQSRLPVFLSASRITQSGDDETVAEGAAELRKGNTGLDADRITYWRVEDEVEAVGAVRLRRDADRMSGEKLRLNLTENTGFLERPAYSILRTPKVRQLGVALVPQAVSPPPRIVAGEVVGDTSRLTRGSGTAERLEFLGENRERLTGATYSTCSVDPPDWHFEMRDLELDHDRETGEARDAKLVFRDVPLFYSPWVGFSLNNQRKSGLLSPTIGSSTRTGIDVTLPYYWNIAPNMDATISPRLMSKRGMQLGAEFRYLDRNYSGQMRGEWLPDDAILKRRRGAYSLYHVHNNLGGGIAGMLALNGVSDDTYFTDTSSRIASTSQTNLLRQGTLSYGGGWWSAVANVQRYQTLQDPSLAPVGKPYERTPQLVLTASRPEFVGGTAFAFNGEYVNFSHPTADVGRRLTLNPQVSWPLQTAGYYVTPKLGLHVTRYDLTRRTSSGPEQIVRTLPTFSLDSGATFERDIAWFGRDLTQTLEPRLFYLLVPKRTQEQIPNFDSGATDFNYATIFSENPFTGGDRIADANQLTAALTSRLVDPQTGQEYVRGMVGQRYYLASQEVTLPGMPVRSAGASDFVAALSGQVLPKIYSDAAWQYNPRDRRTERFVVGARWQPEFAKVLNASYRFTHDSNTTPVVPGIRQIDLSAQWPLAPGWHGVGRYNYSLREHRLIETVAGVERDAGCWVARFVVQRFATTTGGTNTSFFVQLELNGFSRVGSNPLELLKRSIPGYGQINQPTADPAFGAN